MTRCADAGRPQSPRRIPLALLTTALLLAAGEIASAGALGGARCDRIAAAALSRCFANASQALRACHQSDGRTCAADDPRLLDARSRLDARVMAGCPDAAIVRDLGYGPLFTPGALALRLGEACLGEAQALASRSFGGPQGALLDSAPLESEACLDAAYRHGRRLTRRAFGILSRCARRARFGAGCSPTRAANRIDLLDRRTAARIDRDCSDLSGLVGMAPATFTGRARAQARCMTAAAHADTGPLALDCGPRPAATPPQRGQWTQVILDGAEWGTRCGDGSPYAFWIRLAPEGLALENVLVHLQGGGVCIFVDDCLAAPSSLFEATNDYQPSGPSGGYFSTDPIENPFADWTMLALPYCTQDLHIGGGVSTEFSGGLVVHRYGALNVRAALRTLRDVLWAELDATSAEGYRPDRLTVLFGGTSAGGFGVSYNYHYLLDELRWASTTAVPDSSLALDNGSALFGVRGLGGILTVLWNTSPFQAPYCLGGACALVPLLNAATAPRLKDVPHQQILNVSNQVDQVQVETTFFSSSPAWTNAARRAYCDTQGLNGIFSFLPAQPAAIHGILPSTSRFAGLTSDGVSVRDFLGAAMSDPDLVVDRVEEGSLALDPAIDPFACAVD